MTDTLIPDVSYAQAGATAPDWAGIKAKNGGAGICRIGYGLGFPNAGNVDPTFVGNYTAMKQLNYKFIGVYHYLRAGQDAAAQARQFCQWMGPPSAVFPGTVFILDHEEGSGDQSGRANQWLSVVDAFYGLDKLPLDRRSWIYSGDSFARSQGLAGIFTSARHSWVAAYRSSEAGLLPHTLWQSTNGQVGANIVSWAGCGRVDTSIAHHSLSELAAMGWQPTAPPEVNLTGLAVASKVAHADVTFKWDAFSVPGVSYTVTATGMNGTVYATAESGSNSVTLPGLVAGWTYDVKVTVDGGPSATIRVTI